MRGIIDSEKKLKMIEDYNKSEYVIGDKIKINSTDLIDTYRRTAQEITCKIMGFEDEFVLLKEEEGTSLRKALKSKIIARNIHCIGANPFPSFNSKVSSINYTLASVIHNLNIFEKQHDYVTKEYTVKDLCWEPVVIGNDHQPYKYQRDYVWSLEDQQSLIDSIYNNIACGSIVIRKRSFDELDLLHKKYGITDLGFNDIVDGKQRLNTIRRFILSEFPDRFGNYFSDFSFQARHHFVNHQLISYSEMEEDISDKDVLIQFLKVNFTGVLQSKEHIEYVNQLSNRLQ